MNTQTVPVVLILSLLLSGCGDKTETKAEQTMRERTQSLAAQSRTDIEELRSRVEWLETETLAEITPEDRRVTVIDGDTIRIGDEVIRLQAMDAPERSQTCEAFDTEEMILCGLIARDRLQKLINGKIVTCVRHSTDRYERTVATCSVDGKDLGESMVSSGWAIAYRRFGTQYVDAEAGAESDRVGLWSMRFQSPLDWRKEHPRSPTDRE